MIISTRLRQLIRAVYKSMLFVVVGLIIIETGLQLRIYISKKFAVKPSVNTEIPKILVIGDSFVGMEGQEDGLYSSFKKKLSLNLSNNIEILNESYSVNTSYRMNETIDATLEKFKPNLSIILLGNTDYIGTENKKFKTPYYGVFIKKYLYRSHLYKFYAYFRIKIHYYLKNEFNLSLIKLKRRIPNDSVKARSQKVISQIEEIKKNAKLSCRQLSVLMVAQSYSDIAKARENLTETEKCTVLEKNDKEKSILYSNFAKTHMNLKEKDKAEYYFKLAIQSDPSNFYAILPAAQFYYRNKNCKKAIEHFERLIALNYPVRLRWEFLFLKKCYFSEKRTEEGIAFFDKMAQQKNVNSNFIKVMANMLRIETGLKRSELNFEQDRDYYVMMLYYFRKNNLKEEANEIFINKENFDISDEAIIDLKNYRELLKKLLLAGSKIIVLQYPNQPDWPVLDAIAPFREKVDYVSLSDMFESKLDHVSVLELFQHDFFHLTKTGAEILAEGLAREAITALNLGRK